MILKRRFFVTNLLLFLIPIMIPLGILGTLSISITDNYVKEYSDKSDRNILFQTRESLNLVMSVMDPISFMLDYDAGVTSFFDGYFGDATLDYAGVKSQGLINGFFSSLVLPRPYVDSIYVYYANDNDYFYVSTEGRQKIGEHRDRDWFASFRNRDRGLQDWTEVRNIAVPGREGKPRTVLSVYRVLARGTGVVVLNLMPDVLKTIWQGLETLPGQDIMVLNQSGQVVFANHEVPAFPPLRLLGHRDEREIFNFEGRDYVVSTLAYDRYGWSIRSITPEESLYAVPRNLSRLTTGLLILSFVAGLLLTLYLVRINYRQVETIMGILESADKGRPLPPLPERIQNVYGQIAYDILKAFVEQKYLKLQLSEKNSRTRILELEIRRQQMNPHFLFNTLKTIYWKTFALTGGPNDATMMIENLSEILDYSLHGSEQTIALSREIAATKSYIEIQQVRYAGRFDVVWECPKSLEIQAALMLILQPLIENAIYHGIKEKDGTSTIRIRARKSGDICTLTVEDDGIGMDRATLDAVTARMADPDYPLDHIGLSNTNRRIKLAFGDEYGLRIDSSPGKGTKVDILLPWRTAGP